MAFHSPEFSPSEELTTQEIIWVQMGNDGILLLQEQPTDPSPTTNYGKIYTKDDHHLYYEDQDGNITQIDGGSSGATPETPTGTVNAVNAQFTPSARPKWVVSDGATYFEGVGYSWDGTHVNMDIPPSEWIRDIV